MGVASADPAERPAQKPTRQGARVLSVLDKDLSGHDGGEDPARLLGQPARSSRKVVDH